MSEGNTAKEQLVTLEVISLRVPLYQDLKKILRVSVLILHHRHSSFVLAQSTSQQSQDSAVEQQRLYADVLEEQQCNR